MQLINYDNTPETLQERETILDSTECVVLGCELTEDDLEDNNIYSEM